MPRFPTHRVAVVVFADVPGADAGDAVNRLAIAVGDRLGERLPTPHRGRGEVADTEILDVVDLAAAAANGYVVIQPAPRLPHERDSR